MEVSAMVMENLDSLWFFANVLSRRTEEAQLNPSTEEDALKEEQPPTATTTVAPISQNSETPSPISLISGPKKSPECGEIGSQPVQPLGEAMKSVEFARKVENEEERRTNRRRRNRISRKILREGDGFGVDFEFWRRDFYRRGSNWQLVGKGAEACERYERDFAGENLMKMPPLNDGIAMKEHLKSWAYAVACTVR